LTLSTHAPGRVARDIQLTRALGVLAAAGLLSLVAGVLLGSFFEEGASSAELAAGWLGVTSFLPWLAALGLALDAFRSDGAKRSDRLRQAALLAAASFALEAAAGVLTLASLETPLPRGYRAALDAAILSACGLIAASLIAARAFAPRRMPKDRARGLARTFFLVAVGYGFGVFSAIYYAIAFANYPSHVCFVQGFKSQAFGALVVAVAGVWTASAFRRSARASQPEERPFNRERVLFRAACLLALAFLIFCLGEILIALGTVPIGYSQTAESARWVGVVANLATVAAIVCAAIGFRRAARD
jgi:hypothetical protein